MPNHVVLLGDSIFDNARYVESGEPDVIRQVQERLPHGSKATLRAVDGSMTVDVRRQLQQLPAGATHLILSCGGNDAISHRDILGAPAVSTAEVLTKLARVGDDFERNYRQMLLDVLVQRLPTVLCTIYYPRFLEAALQRIAVTALTIFNDSIIRQAFTAKVQLFDLRLFCSEE